MPAPLFLGLTLPELLATFGIGVASSTAVATTFKSLDNSTEAITAMLAEINQILLDGFAGRDVDLESFARQLVHV